MKKKFEVGSGKLELTCRRFIPTFNFSVPTSYAAGARVARQRESQRVCHVSTFTFTVFAFAATAANACPVCFGDPSAPSAKGMNAAIWFLLAMVAFVQAGFVALFVTFWRRSRALRRRRESLQLLHGGLR